jgi:hypothetical protein
MTAFPAGCLACSSLALLFPLAYAQESEMRIEAAYFPGTSIPYSDSLDLDGDGDLDLLGTQTNPGPTYSYRHFRPYLNTGQGKFSWGTYRLEIDNTTNSSNHMWRPLAIAAGTIGTPDAAEEFVFAYANTVHTYRWTGSDTALDEQHTTSGLVLAATTGDYDGDGRGDYAVLTSTEVNVYLHPQGGAVQVLVAHCGTGWYDIETGSFCPGGGDDLVLVGDRLVELRSFQALPRTGAVKSLSIPKSFAHGLAHPMLTVGDVDGNGDDDVVLFSPSTYRVLRQNRGRFTLNSILAGGPATGLADIDQDGDLDGVCCGGGGLPPLNSNFRSDFEISLNDGSGQFAHAFKIQGNGASRIAAAADLDGDGDADLAAGHVLYYSSGAITPPLTIPLASGEPSRSAVGDFDGDGDPDLEIGTNQVFLNQGDGRFVVSTPALPSPPPGTTFLGPGFPGDLDADGATDLLVECWSGPTFAGLHWLQNQGGGSFEDLGTSAMPATAFSEMTTLSADSCRIADFDGDGLADLAVLSARGDPDLFTWIWFNEGNGSFSEGPLWSGERLLAAGALDPGAFPDLVVAKDGLRKRLGLGNRTFAAPMGFPSFYGTFSTAATFDPHKDECALMTTALSPPQQDVVAILRLGSPFPTLSRYAQILPGSGSTPGQQISLPIYGDETLPYRVFGADLDGDGLGEGILSPAAAEGCSWVRPSPLLWGSSSAIFDAQMAFLATAFADVDGDGDIDALGERVYRGRKYEGADSGARLQYAYGFPGSGGVTPTLGAVGPFRAGAAIEFRITGGVGGALCHFKISRAVASLANTPVLGVTTWIDPGDPAFQIVPVILSGTPGVSGVGKATIPFTIPAGYAGLSEYFQAFLLDPGAPNGVSATNGLRIDFGS